MWLHCQWIYQPPCPVPLAELVNLAVGSWLLPSSEEVAYRLCGLPWKLPPISTCHHSCIWMVYPGSTPWPDLVIPTMFEFAAMWTWRKSYSILKTTLADHNWDRCRSQIRRFDPNPGVLTSDDCKTQQGSLYVLHGRGRYWVEQKGGVGCKGGGGNKKMSGCGINNSKPELAWSKPEWFKNRNGGGRGGWKCHKMPSHFAGFGWRMREL